MRHRSLVARVVQLLALGALCGAASACGDAERTGGVTRLAVEGPLDDASVAALEGSFAALASARASRLVVRISSPGGTLSASRRLAELLFAVPAPTRVIAWIPEGAYGGAALAALACDAIVMAPEAELGGMVPFLATPEGVRHDEEAAAAVRREALRFATANGHAVGVVTSLLDARAPSPVAGLVLTAEEALAKGLVARLVEREAALLEGAR